MDNKRKRLPPKWLTWIGIVTLGGLFLIFIIYLYIAYLLPLPGELYLKPRNLSTKIYDRHGALLYEVLNPHEGRKTYLKLSEMPPLFLKATLASEDSGFYDHVGVDLGAVARALLFNYLEQKITSGASTITQQLVRNLLGTNRERNLQEKLIESIYAIRISHLYNKNEVLEQYLNTVYFGNLSYGAAEAAQNYFGKTLSDLDLAELSLLAGLPKSPSNYNPLVNLDSAKKRQQYVLQRMVELDYIQKHQAEEAYGRPLKFASGKTSIEAPHFVHQVLAELEDRYGQDFIYNGLSIKTTLDLGLQKKAEQIIKFHLDKLQDKNVTNAALLATDSKTGQILVWVGNRDYFNAKISGQVNIVNSLRQPGSALKPFLYLLALENGYTLADTIADLPLKIKTDSGVYSPLNYDLDFHGPVRIREALANSFNIPAVKMQEQLGTAKFLSFLRNLGLRTLDKEPQYYGLALTLGGGEIRLYDLANAYLTLANYGRQKPFSTILEIKKNSGENVYKWAAAPGRNLLGPNGQQNSFLIIDALSDPNARLKSFGEGNVLELSFPAAVKTGTTRNFKDNWTVGFSPDLLTAVWVGNADATAMENISGIDGAGPIWRDFMEYVHEQVHYSNRSFNIPSSLIRTSICAVSGLAISEYCQEQLEEWFVAGTQPQKTDNFWQMFQCPDGQRFYQVFPFPYEEWAQERGFTPPQQCLQLTFNEEIPVSKSAIQFISPLAGDSFRLNSDLPLSNQKIPLKIFVYPRTDQVNLPMSSQVLVYINNEINFRHEISTISAPLVIQDLLPPQNGLNTLKVSIFGPDQQLLLEDQINFKIE